MPTDRRATCERCGNTTFRVYVEQIEVPTIEDIGKPRSEWPTIDGLARVVCTECGHPYGDEPLPDYASRS